MEGDDQKAQVVDCFFFLVSLYCYGSTSLTATFFFSSGPGHWLVFHRFVSSFLAWDGLRKFPLSFAFAASPGLHAEGLAASL